MIRQEIEDKWPQFTEWLKANYPYLCIPQGIYLIEFWTRYLEEVELGGHREDDSSSSSVAQSAY